MKLMLFVLTIFFFGCNAQEAPNLVQQKEKNPIPFDLQLEIQNENNKHFLVTSIKLNQGDYIISPFSKDGFYGNLTFSLEDSTSISFGNELQEIPESTAEFDPIITKAVRFVRENTVYKQSIEIQKQSDFETKGKVWFLLEPICIPFQVEFVCIHKNGTLDVQVTAIGIDRESYKGTFRLN